VAGGPAAAFKAAGAALLMVTHSFGRELRRGGRLAVLPAARIALEHARGSLAPTT